MKNIKKRTVLKNYDRIVAFTGGIPEMKFTTKDDNLKKLSAYSKINKTVSTLSSQMASFNNFEK